MEAEAQTIATVIPMLDDATAFAEVYGRIRRYVGSLVRDPSEAEDLTQEVFLRAHRGRASLRDAEAGMTWLYRIATHVSVDRMRARARRPLAAEATPDEIDPADAGPALQQVIEQQEMSACVQSYLTALPDKYRGVLLLRDLHDMSGPEIAEHLGISLATVKIRLYRARQKLRAALEAACAFERDERNVLICERRA